MTLHLPKQTPVGNESMHFFSFKQQPGLLPLSSAGTTAGSAEVMRQLARSIASWLMTKGNPPRACAGPKSGHSLTANPNKQSSNDPNQCKNKLPPAEHFPRKQRTA
ncbi:hypothetical protein SporoP37_10660 [Sporosarcina sp. P37]|nr:hypothetical protein SporoP33_10245 [Sporosarcina sp. P33]ARK25063.1 hypothetical protein SporoP37_10660 [Sporosarcina sp. P37]PID17947.1 hypothetical protein CSV62_11225 [Sporosarcina sp. P35]